MKLISCAKVNLGLHITGRREDGYHLMETLFYPVKGLFDEIELTPAKGGKCSVEMEGLAETVPIEQNLCWKAWNGMAAKAVEAGLDPGLKIHVKKRIPAGAGLGGGSSNAACVLKGLNKLWNLGIPDAELARAGETLGADIPFFIYNRPLYATGIGTVFEEFPLNLAAMGLRLEVFPLPIHSSTPMAFKGLDIAALPSYIPLKELLKLPLDQWQGKVRNDLEGPVFARIPQVAKLKADLIAQGAVFASMSGSGSACLGIFRD
jgi:4-diphosphocytidyl-2-C-methyl-D-erythritol kinase